MIIMGMEAASCIENSQLSSVLRRQVMNNITAACNLKRYQIPYNGCKRFPRISNSSIGNTTSTGCFFSGCMTNEQNYVLSRRWASRFDRKERSVTKAQEEGREKSGVDDSETPFFATVEFWLQAAIVVLTFGFVDAGYSGDWSRIGALSPEGEAQLRVAAYVIVPVSAALVLAISKRQKRL